MPSFKKGTPIFFDRFKEQMLMRAGDGEEVTDDDVRKAMALEAMRAKSQEENDAILQLNGMKEQYGVGVSTRVMIYNATGAPMIKRATHNSSGSWSTNVLADRIETGEWSLGFHEKGGGATGSISGVYFELAGYGIRDIIFVPPTPSGEDEALQFPLPNLKGDVGFLVGFNTPYTSAAWDTFRNSALARVLGPQDHSKPDWGHLMSLVHASASHAQTKQHKLFSTYEIDQGSSPTMTVVVTRSDIGFGGDGDR